MKVTVDQDACIGCGLCCDLCPSVFFMKNDGKADVQKAEGAPRDAIMDAKDSCPTAAILVSE